MEKLKNTLSVGRINVLSCSIKLIAILQMTNPAFYIFTPNLPLLFNNYGWYFHSHCMKFSESLFRSWNVCTLKWLIKISLESTLKKKGKVIEVHVLIRGQCLASHTCILLGNGCYLFTRVPPCNGPPNSYDLLFDGPESDTEFVRDHLVLVG